MYNDSRRFEALIKVNLIDPNWKNDAIIDSPAYDTNGNSSSFNKGNLKQSRKFGSE